MAEIVYNKKELWRKTMSVTTNNAYGKISIADPAIAKVATHTAMESYGIVEVVTPRSKKDFPEFYKIAKGYKSANGVKVTTFGNRIYLDICVVIRYGVSIEAVAESLKEAIKYKVEVFTGMLVDTINVNVVGVKL